MASNRKHTIGSLKGVPRNVIVRIKRQDPFIYKHNKGE